MIICKDKSIFEKRINTATGSCYMGDVFWDNNYESGHFAILFLYNNIAIAEWKYPFEHRGDETVKELFKNDLAKLDNIHNVKFINNEDE